MGQPWSSGSYNISHYHFVVFQLGEDYCFFSRARRYLKNWYTFDSSDKQAKEIWVLYTNWYAFISQIHGPAKNLQKSVIILIKIGDATFPALAQIQAFSSFMEWIFQLFLRKEFSFFFLALVQQVSGPCETCELYRSDTLLINTCNWKFMWFLCSVIAANITITQ